MPRAKRTKKFATMKRMISLSDPRIKVLAVLFLKVSILYKFPLLST